MTIEEIKTYLRKHLFMVFRYHSKCYSLKKSSSLFHSQYSLIATDAQPDTKNSLEELCEKAYVSNDTLLIEAIEYIEVPEQNDPFWKTYEAVRHSAIIYGREIHFIYYGKSYWIAHTADGSSHLSDDLGNTQTFSSCRDLFKNARIGNSSLEKIWEKIIVDAC